MLKPGDAAPRWDLPCAFDDHISHLSLDGIRSELVVVFFYPRDFSFICPTEVSGFHNAQAAFRQEQTSIVGISVDDAETHLRWARELGGISYPLVADADGKLASQFGVFDEKEKTAMRATFILDAERSVAYAVASAINVGRSVSETLRVARALRSGRMCPADWQPGGDFDTADRKA
ncbi:MAG TPA: redoxin domain-containing protein [Candidatus Binataceae bacterium]|nr:redoxin domain-containing protein [Candidatus Binataceae bacterium]